jgi:serine/threonine protein kinase
MFLQNYWKKMTHTPLLGEFSISKVLRKISSDLWALGCMIFQFLSGKPPFKGPTAYQTFQLIRQREFSFPNDFPDDAKDLVDRLLVSFIASISFFKDCRSSYEDWEWLKWLQYFEGTSIFCWHRLYSNS